MHSLGIEYTKQICATYVLSLFSLVGVKFIIEVNEMSYSYP